MTYITTFTCSVPLCEEVLAAQNKVFKLLRVFKILLVKVYIFNKKKDPASSFSNHGDILTNMIVPSHASRQKKKPTGDLIIAFHQRFPFVVFPAWQQLFVKWKPS